MTTRLSPTEDSRRTDADHRQGSGPNSSECLWERGGAGILLAALAMWTWSGMAVVVPWFLARRPLLELAVCNDLRASTASTSTSGVTCPTAALPQVCRAVAEITPESIPRTRTVTHPDSCTLTLTSLTHSLLSHPTPHTPHPTPHTPHPTPHTPHPTPQTPQPTPSPTPTFIPTSKPTLQP